MKKKILILNGSHSELLLIRAAKKFGLHVTTIGNRAELVGHKESDEYFNVDYTNKQAVLDLAQKLKIDYICSCANDAGAMTAAYVAEKLGLPGHDSYQTLSVLLYKDQFKEFALPRGYPTPKAISFFKRELVDREKYQLNFPLIVKPADRSGGKGISTARTEVEFNKAVDLAFKESPGSTIVVEEFIEGTLHSFSTFLVNQKVVACFGDNEYPSINPFTVSTSAAPSTGLEVVRDKMIEVSESMAKDLKLVDGIFHHQYIFDGQNPHILEITRRCSGDVYPYPVQMALGINWAEWIVKAEMGMDCRDFPESEQKGFVGRHCFMATKNGTIREFVVDPMLKGNIENTIYAFQPGDKVSDFMTQKLAVAMLRFSSREEMLEKVSKINELTKVLVD